MESARKMPRFAGGEEPSSIAAAPVENSAGAEAGTREYPYVRWEFLSMIIWDDDPKSSVTSDLEDVEVLNLVGAEGWELVCVVPLARTQVLEMAYPGNTRKLVAYFKRPRV